MEIAVLPILETFKDIAMYLILLGIIIVIVYLILLLIALIKLLKMTQQRIQQLEQTFILIQNIIVTQQKIMQHVENVVTTFFEIQKNIARYISKSTVDTLSILTKALKKRSLKKQVGDK